MMKSVLFLIPQGSMTDEDRASQARLYPHIEFQTIDPLRPLDIIPQKIGEGIEIIAGRGKTASDIRRAFPQLHVVEIPITAYDVIRSINAVDCRGKTIAVITNKADIIGLNVFSEACKVRILNYILTPFNDMRKAISDARDRGAELVLGGAITRLVAKSLGMPFLVFPLGPESMRHVLNEVRQVQSTIDIEARRQGLMNRLMDNILEGVVAVDNDNIITAMNSAARRLLGQSERPLVGEPLALLGDVFASHAGEMPEEGIIRIRNNTVMLHRIPIMHRKRTFGTLFTLHEGRKIASMEKSIRTEIYAKEHEVRYSFADVLGDSPVVRQTVAYAKSYACTESNIMLTGESGSGKEVFAQSIHQASARRAMPFVAVNCAALPHELLHSELFGYVEGAFTGALRKGKAGLFEIAHTGTIFLDEISEMDYATQGNLLRVVQERYVVRLGSHKPISIDARIIAATNKDLSRLVREGRFREDLFYRLNVLALEVPPLRRRGGDIVPLMLHFLNSFPSPWKGKFSLADAAGECLGSHTWPGNIRELSNVAERIAATARRAEITYEQMRWAMQIQGTPEMEITEECVRARQIRKLDQQEVIRHALAECSGNVSEAARRLGIDRTTLWRRMKRAGTNNV